MMRVCPQDCSDSQKLPRDGLFSWEKTTRLHFAGMLMTWGVYQEWNLMTKDEILNAGFEGRARQERLPAKPSGVATEQNLCLSNVFAARWDG